jgi:predicted MFS family arabinose efflux permease
MAKLDPEQSISCASHIVHQLAFYLSVGRDDPEGMTRFLRRRDRALWAVAALAFVNAVADAALLPVLPTLQERFALSGMQMGALLSAATIVTLLASVPIGLVAGRIGSPRLLLASAALLPVSLAVMAVADGLGLLIAGRALFGLAFAILWSIAPAVAAGSGRGAAGTGRLIAAAGMGWLVGPVLAGAVTDAWGYRTAFVVVAVLTLPLVAVLACDRSEVVRVAPTRLRDAVGAAVKERALAGAMLVTALLGVVTGVSGLLAPLVLADNGLSAGGIGAAIALSAVIFTAGAALSTRIPSARINVRVVGAIAAVLAATFLIPIVSFSTFAVVGFLVLGAGARAVLNTVVFALARAHAPSEALATPIVGVLNVAWSAAALVAPLAAGVALSAGGARWAFMATAVTGFAVAVWMLLPQPRAAYA